MLAPASCTSSKYKQTSGQIGDGEAFVLVALALGLLVISLISSFSLMFIIFKLNLFPGYELISFNPTDQSVLLNGQTTLSHITLDTPVIKGVQSIQGNVRLTAGQSSISINDDSVEFKSPNGLKVISPTTGEEIFPAKLASLPLPSTLSTLSLPGGVKGIRKIRSPIDQDLVIESKAGVLVRGNQGLNLHSKIVTISGKQVHLKSSNGSIELSAGSSVNSAGDSVDADPDAGIYLPAIPTVTSHDSYPMRNLQYKLCVCGKNGKVFKLHMRNRDTTCADVRFPESENPCVL